MNEIRTTLPGGRDASRTARQFVAAHTPRLGAGAREDAMLVTSELVTNALRHGSGAIRLRIVEEPSHVLVEVADEGAGRVSMLPEPDARGGWGLRLVDSVAEEWGAARGSTRVWFRLRLDEATAHPSGGVGRKPPPGCGGHPS